MLRIISIIASTGFALFILLTSVVRTSTPKYAFYQQAVVSPEAKFVSAVQYDIPQPGVLPDNLLWPLKAARDKIWETLTFNSAKKSELLLLFADKRIVMAEELMLKGKGELGIVTATKAEQYLEEALDQEVEASYEGIETGDLAESLAKAALKHREILEKSADVVPTDAKPVLNQLTETPRKVYEKSVHRLNEKGRNVPTPIPKIGF